MSESDPEPPFSKARAQPNNASTSTTNPGGLRCTVPVLAKERDVHLFERLAFVARRKSGD